MSEATLVTTGLLLSGGALALVLVLRDLLYRVFIIRPITDVSGRYATFIEENHIYRWLVPVLAGEQGPIDVYFAGNSHVMDSIDCSVVRSETGLTCYNLAVYATPSQNAVQLLEVFKQYPRMVVMDFSTRYSMYNHAYDDWFRRCVLKAADTSRTSGMMWRLADRVSWLTPSFFVPRQFSPVLLRSLGKAKHYFETKRMAIGRYTPFRPFVSYDWRLEKSTNHRIARRVRRRSQREIEREEYLVGQRIEEMPQRCDVESELYREGMALTKPMVESLLGEGVQVMFMRLPLHPRLIEHENRYFSRFWDDIRGLADDLHVDFVDLTTAEHASEIGELEFYSDGHHVCHPGDIAVSRYVAKLLRDRLRPGPK